jgi:predicted metal-dependent phosphoesterase TrpH
MGKADLHAHTRHTDWGDGNQTIADLFRYVEQQTDLDLFGITDHDITEGARAAWDIHRRGGYRFAFLPGVEVTNLSGHLLCYFPEGRIVDIPSLRPFWWTVQYAQAHGAICVAAHPVYPPWLAPTILRGHARGLRLDGIEAVNAGISERAQVRLDSIVARLEREGGSGIPRSALVGNSDAHDQIAVGAAYTRFPGRTIDDFLLALRKRETEPVFVQRPQLHPAARSFTTRRSMTRPGWVHNIWQEVRGRHT